MMIFNLSALPDMLLQTNYSFICNAVGLAMKERGLSVELYRITRQLRKQFVELFPEEFHNNPSEASSILDSWVTTENQQRFFSNNTRKVDTQRARLDFLEYLIEKYGDKPLVFEV
jgi:hypothetical protein